METFQREMVCDFFVPGKPEPAGSKQSFVPLNKKTAHPEIDGIVNKLLARGGLSEPEREQLILLRKFSKAHFPKGVPYIDEHDRIVVSTVDANKNAGPWKEVVATYARFAWGANRGLIDEAVGVEFVFHMPRIKGHYGTGRNSDKLKPSAPTVHTVMPDGLKLSRAVEDALTGVIWKDDARIADERFQKIYSSRPGVHVRVFLLKFDPVDQEVPTQQMLALS